MSTQPVKKNEPATPGPLLITRAQAATRYAFSVRYIDSLIENGTIPVVRMSQRCLRIPLEAAGRVFLDLTTGGRKSA